ncbi:U3 small nucleolar RNA-associated protein 14 homolog A-like isoform X2 [Odontomachus brunneus]|uniref:U3 small nucleolar RNA-associated protein 14 homolog A-like isoform X2 n=1 Tax=Odontomachus brunneus TaxID=486640 RepID=UPI0013F28342|nr:U3 small nucleolar RNA-associated protein 14 homolog A-like isoform X2 [Odontomachus brunneus]
MSDLEVAYNSDQEVSKNHSKFIEAIAQLDKKQRVNKAERSEPTLEVSEFHLVKSAITNKDAVQVRDLVKSLGQKGYQSQITKKLRSIQKSKAIFKPLEKPTAEKVKMRFGFECTLKDLSRWDAIVAKNRTATHLTFPLKTPKQKLKIDSPADFINHLRFKSDLQQKLEELNPKLEDSPPEEERRDNEEEKFKMRLKDMKKKRSETAKYRAQQSYQEMKAHRQGKIKSKKFHRTERKKRDKEQLVEFEKLQKTDPEKALTMLAQLDKSRAEERMSLRHKSTGQWAKNKQIRAKYDKETRQELAKQLSIGRDLTQKVRLASDNDEDKTSFTFANMVEEPPNNSETVSEVNELIECYREYRDKKKSEEKTVAKVDSKSKSPANKLDENKKSYTKTKYEVSKFAKGCLKHRDRKEEESEEESVAKVDSASKSSVNKLDNISNDMLEKQISEPNIAKPTIKSNSRVGEINLQNPHSMNIKSKHLKTEIPDLDVDEEDVLDNDEQEENFDRFIDEVMENSDAEKEFRKEKEEEIKNSQPETINHTSLPGWGSWAGTNIKKSKMRRILKQASELLLWVDPLCRRMLTDD